jgi:hypothetical protein
MQPSVNKPDNAKLLSAFAQQAMSRQDTPALIQWVASDADRIALCHAVVMADMERDPVFFQRLERACQLQGISLSRLQQRLVPVLHSLGLLQANQETDLYQTLGVPPDADDEKIRGAFRAKARLLHPDTRTDGRTESDLFIALNIAYQTLIDPESRRQYDLRRGHSRSWLETGDQPVAERVMAPSRLKPAMQMGGMVLALIGCVYLVNAYYHSRVLSEAPAAPYRGNAPPRASSASRASDEPEIAGRMAPARPDGTTTGAAAREIALASMRDTPEVPRPGDPVSQPRKRNTDATSTEKESKTVTAFTAGPLAYPTRKPTGKEAAAAEYPQGNGSGGGGSAATDVQTAARESIERFLALREQERQIKKGAHQASTRQIAQEPAAPVSGSVFITPGDWVEVQVEGLALRPTPRAGGEKKRVLPVGSRAKVLEGPLRAEGFIWWHVEAEAGERGWVAERQTHTADGARPPVQMLSVVAAGPPQREPLREAGANPLPSSGEGAGPSPTPAPAAPRPDSDQLQEFLDRFCKLYSGKDLFRFAGLFEAGATENGTPVLELLPVYQRSFSTMEAIDYRIALQRHAVRPASGTLAVKGRYALRWRNTANGDALHDEGVIELELVGPDGDGGFKIKSMRYRSGRET